jgi:hypothetical protein
VDPAVTGPRERSAKARKVRRAKGPKADRTTGPGIRDQRPE